MPGDLWAANSRRIDLRILWPECKKAAKDMDTARAVFAMHAFNDWAWHRLGDYDDIYEAIEALE